eukprot:21772-Rhodomonas_salina.1
MLSSRAMDGMRMRVYGLIVFTSTCVCQEGGGQLALQSRWRARRERERRPGVVGGDWGLATVGAQASNMQVRRR